MALAKYAEDNNDMIDERFYDHSESLLKQREVADWGAVGSAESHMAYRQMVSVK